MPYGQVTHTPSGRPIRRGGQPVTSAPPPRAPARAPNPGYTQNLHPANISVSPHAERQYTAAYNYLAHPLNAAAGLNPAAQALLPDVLDASARYGIPASLLLAQENQESGFDPTAVSSAGAFGVSQFIPSTAASYGVKPGASPKAVRSQVMGQAHYLADLGFNKDPQGALSSYSGGYSAGAYNNPVLSAAQQYGGVDQAVAKRARAQGIVERMTGGAGPRTPGGGTGGGGLTPQMAARQFKGHYVNPYGTPTEVDMGVDYGGTGTLGAIGKSRVVGESSFGGGPYIALELLKGPRKGWTDYVAEGINPLVHPGDIVKKGQPVAQQTSGIEAGWAGSPKVPYRGGAQTLASATGDPRVAGRHSNFTGTPSESDPVAGRDFLNFLQGKPGIGGVDSGAAAGAVSGFSSGFGGSVPVDSSGAPGAGNQPPAMAPYAPAYPSSNRGGFAASAATPTSTTDLEATLNAILGGGSTAQQGGTDASPLAQILRRQRFRPRR